MLYRTHALVLGVMLSALLGLAACVERPGPTAAGPSFDVSKNPGPPLPSGAGVTFYLATSGNLPEPDPGPPTDVLVFTGGPTSVTQIPGCTDLQLPLQDAVLVDAAGGRSSRRVFAIIGLGDEPVPPGTRVADFAPGLNCVSDGVGYRKYTATVE